MPATSGDILNLRDIEQALENLKRVPTAEANIEIVPAEGENSQPGESDLVITWKQKSPKRYSFSIDDSGTESTGVYQSNLTISYDNPWSLNDLLYISLNHDLGGGDSGKRYTRGYSFHYSVPYDYWLLGFNASRSQYYQTVVGLVEPYGYRGDSHNYDLSFSRLHYRDAKTKVSGAVKASIRDSKNFIDDFEVLPQRRRMAAWDMDFSYKRFLKQGSFDAKLTYRLGTGMLGRYPHPRRNLETERQNLAL